MMYVILIGEKLLYQKFIVLYLIHYLLLIWYGDPQDYKENIFFLTFC